MKDTRMPNYFARNIIYKNFNQLAFLTPPFLGGISAEVCEISPHNSDFLKIFGQMMVNFLCKWLGYFEILLFTLF
jgi:hypothetical protein